MPKRPASYRRAGDTPSVMIIDTGKLDEGDEGQAEWLEPRSIPSRSGSTRQSSATTSVMVEGHNAAPLLANRCGE